MGLHKLTAGDGYTYLTRQVAAQDVTERGFGSLGDYYAEKGESPGRWAGSGLAGLGIEPGARVTEIQMRNLFGQGRHPDAERILLSGWDPAGSLSGRRGGEPTALGRPFAVYDGPPHPLRQEVARRAAVLNQELGHPSRAPLSVADRARLRTEVADELFAAEHGRAPRDERERAGFVARASRQRTTAVAGYDLTFTPVKSVSVLWALADRQVAGEIEAAHDAAVAATLDFLERQVLFTRRGRAGVQQVKTRGLVAAAFTHRDARSGDPNLHTHMAISNKVQDATGAWLAVDGRPLHKAAVTLSETYNTLLEAELGQRLGLRFAAVNRSDGKRSVREVEGVDGRLIRHWSSRASAIEVRRRELVAVFQAGFGRPPTAVESIALSQQATLETRQAKHPPRRETDQRRAWAGEAERVLGSGTAVTRMVSRAVHRGMPHHDLTCRLTGQLTGRVTGAWVRQTARQVVATVQADRATWQVWHLRAEAHRRLRGRHLPAAAIERTADRIVEAAIRRHCVSIEDPDPLLSLAVTPAALRRPDGCSVYRLHADAVYTSRTVVDAEGQLLRTARRSGGRRAGQDAIAGAVAAATARGMPLSTSQRELVETLATSGARLQLALAPAGAGKTTAMEVLADAWRRSGGEVLGLAPSAVAAQLLGEALNPFGAAAATGAGGDPCAVGGSHAVAETLSKLAWSLRPGVAAPEWVRRIGHRTLVLVDEAGMASTLELAAVVRHVVKAGASVRLVGDDRQLAAVAAGGVLRDLLSEVGAVTLAEVHRFSDPAEAAATLAVRDGDRTSVAFYTDRGRVHVGDASTAAEQAFVAWSTDVAAGRRSLLLAPTRDVVAELNTRARADRLARLGGDVAGVSSAGARERVLSDGSRVSAGDTVLTRRNLRTVRLSATDWVKNGDRWTVETVHDDRSLRVRHDRLRRSVVLPAGYVDDGHVTLGYATTVHGAQGVTVDTCHTVLTGQENRRLLYVALTRGRHANHLYLATTGDGDPHTLIRPETLRPPTAVDQLVAILERDGATSSATTALAQVHDPAVLLRDAAARYHDSLTFAAVLRLDPEPGVQVEVAVERLSAHHRVDLRGAEAWPTLRGHLALHAHLGRDPGHLLYRLAAVRPLQDADDAAAVLDARLADALPLPTGPLPWLPAIPAPLATDRGWGRYLTDRVDRVTVQATQVVDRTGTWTSRSAPAWAAPLVAAGAGQLLADVAVWRAAHDVPDTDLRPTGPRHVGAPGEYQAALDRQVRALRGHHGYTHSTWYRALPDAVRDDVWTPRLCERLARLERAGTAVTDLVTSALSEETPLPDEQPAAALWWRLAGRLGPAVLDRPHPGDTDHAHTLRPAWLPDLDRALTALAHRNATPVGPDGPDATDVGYVGIDQWERAHAWPALVATVDQATRRRGWTPAQTLTSALAHRLAGADVEQQCEALMLAIARLTDAPVHLLVQPPVDPRANLPGEATVDPEARVVDPATGAASPARSAEPSRVGESEPDQPGPRSSPADSRPADTGPQHQPVHLSQAPARTWPALRPSSRSSTQSTGSTRAWVAARDDLLLPPERVAELNDLAAAYFLQLYPRSWAPDYLRARLGPSAAETGGGAAGTGRPTGAAQVPQPGYAPPGPHSLMRRLVATGADPAELLAAGLLREREFRGRRELVDLFRDRVVWPVRRPDGVVAGFIGRRNPTREEHGGPKYLNSPSTSLFTKGSLLFGLAEADEALAAGAVPVLVEGPLDAVAVTLSTDAAAVGLAPLGTALTHEQASLLGTAARVSRQQPLVATDADDAGWRAAQAAFWTLTSADLDPDFLDLPPGADPAGLLTPQPTAPSSDAPRAASGPDALREAIRRRRPLGDMMIDRLLTACDAHTDDATRLAITRHVSLIIGARDVPSWRPTIARTSQQLGLPGGILDREVRQRSAYRDEDRAALRTARPHHRSSPPPR